MHLIAHRTLNVLLRYDGLISDFNPDSEDLDSYSTVMDSDSSDAGLVTSLLICGWWFLTVTVRCMVPYHEYIFWWQRGVVVASLVLINEVSLRWARLVLGWVIVSGFNSRRQHFISVCNQPPRSTQPSTLWGMVKWVPVKGWWCSAAGGKGRHGVICR